MEHTSDKKGMDDLRYTLDNVNMWLNNCDQKAGILLAVIGVVITVVMTSDFLKFLREYILGPFVQYVNGNDGLLFSWGRFLVFVLLLIAMVILVVSCVYLFRAIKANIDYKKMYKENPGLVRKSFFYYGSISEMAYEEFKNDEVNYEEDLRFQIYVNSKIALKKFQNYNEGLFWFKLLLVASVMLFVSVMFVQ